MISSNGEFRQQQIKNIYSPTIFSLIKKLRDWQDGNHNLLSRIQVDKALWNSLKYFLQENHDRGDSK